MVAARRIGALPMAAALLLYGGLSVPAPAVLRGSELSIALLILLSIGWKWPLAVVSGHALRTRSGMEWMPVAVVAFAWLLWVPLLRGAALGWEAADILRDVVPLLFLFLPVLVVPVLRGTGQTAVRALAGGLAMAGLLFALRWWRQADWGFGAIGQRAMADGGVYLLNAPSVLFAAAVLPAVALSLIGAGGRFRHWFASVPCVAGGALCLAALAGAVHRTALGLALLSLLLTAIWWARRRPWLVLPLLLGLGLSVSVGGDALVGAWQQAAEKTRLTGVNARWEEAMAVIDHANATPWTLLFGDGWGARIANPAVGGWRVTYTHMLASYSLLKTGLFGMIALAAYLGALVRPWCRLLEADPPLALAVVPPLLMALCLHTSFKYLDTGVILSLMLLAAECRKGLSVS
ncbi:hypothetical protein TSH100_23760 [Azospirillum sp. TSH100]|uniref:hypothetical protein n=1 Tax=Azospirillum sp. TSH100 TaxID=652764 RepID=UPI000D614AF7|nr:hypothetical protein [Azospirillum sp. TSH100]PWC82392.1 hypothetical protein TSH100_23760 [Azospirillum sp. TSH100]QCG87986.1 hypothetical protein E6C72_09810 [Azospirillum sp. TSH100]